MNKQSILKTTSLIVGIIAISVATTAVTNRLLSEKSIPEGTTVSTPTRLHRKRSELPHRQTLP